MDLTEDLTDAVIKLHSFRMYAEASAAWPSIVATLSRARDRVRAMKPGQRRNASLDCTLDWLRRSACDSQVISEKQRGELEALIGELKSLVGPTTAGREAASAGRGRRA